MLVFQIGEVGAEPTWATTFRPVGQAAETRATRVQDSTFQRVAEAITALGRERGW